MSCEKCTVQVMWESPAGTHYTCADVTVMNSKIMMCLGKCLNEGACVNGVCVCNEPYFGEFCQYKSIIAWILLRIVDKEEIRIGYWWIVFLVLLLVAAGFFIGAYFLNKNRGQGGEHPPIPFIEEPVVEQNAPPQDKEKKRAQVIEVMKDEEVVEEPQYPGQEEQHEEAAPEKQAVDDVCPQGHELSVTKSQVGCPGGYYMCANCKKVVQCSAGRWNCPTCNFDLCPECKPIEGAPMAEDEEQYQDQEQMRAQEQEREYGREQEQDQEQDQPHEHASKPQYKQHRRGDEEQEQEQEHAEDEGEREAEPEEEPKDSAKYREADEPRFPPEQEQEPQYEQEVEPDQPHGRKAAAPKEAKKLPEEEKGSPHESAEAATPAAASALGKDIKLVFQSKLADKILGFMKKGSKGRVTWNKTHFIFVLDCSGSMKGARWNSVKAGYKNCLAQLKKMPEVIVSAFTFDDKPNPFVREKTPAMAATTAERLPFSGKGTNYKRALEFVINIIQKTQHPDYLSCILFLSDGMGGYPEEALQQMIDMRESGKKMALYTIACVTKEDEDMIKMAKMLDGEHYAFENAEAATKVFSAILRV